MVASCHHSDSELQNIDYTATAERNHCQVPTQRLDNQLTCEELVLSGVEQKARGTPEKTSDAGFGCI